MAKFKYTGTDASGKIVTGAVSAATISAARASLGEKDLNIQRIEPSRGLNIELTKAKVPRQDVMLLSRQLAAFIRAGVPILDGIGVIAEESGNSTLRSALFTIADDLRAGKTLSDAVGAHPSIFPRFYVDMLRSAELTGRLDTVLSQLSGYLERDLEAKQKIRSALAYPTIILVLALVTIVVMTVFVVPRFQQFFKSLGAKLPLATRILISITGFISSWWWAILGGLLLLILFVYLSLKTRAGRGAMNKLVLQLPVVGEVVRFAIIERFCRILSAMVQAGVPLPEAMTVVAESANNIVYERGLKKVTDAMLEGEGLSAPISRTSLFPSTVVQMVRVGEDTGTLDEQLETAAGFYEQELTYKIKRMTTLFEPAVLIGVGLLVGFVAVAVVSAMYGIFRQVGSL
ncbi:MAG: type II secretion system F family protein [Actinomycetota bacterium]|nr:type II secretion system F family protein [Actinomycetota bacterium]